MRFVRTNRNQLVFYLGQREHRLLLDVLRLYPLVPAGYHRLSRTADPEQVESDQQLLEETMAAQKETCRTELRAFLQDHRHLRPQGKGYLLLLPVLQVEWFLQVLNDVRVGSWLQLGCPDDQTGEPAELTRANARFFVAMELCAVLQSVLLRALDQPGRDHAHGA